MTEVDLDTPRGSIGTIYIPSDITKGGGTLLITFVTDLPETNDPRSHDLGSTLVDLTLLDENGRSVHNLPDTVKICLKEEKSFKKDSACLSFYDEKREDWHCQDDCLESSSSGYCGTTDHFTSFALLLNGIGRGGGPRGFNDPCHTSDRKAVFSWITLAFVDRKSVV